MNDPAPSPRPAILSPLLLIAYVVGMVLLVYSAISWCSDRLQFVMEIGPRRLVYETNHQAVLDAIRVVLADPQKAGFPPMDRGRTMLDGTQSGGTVPPTIPVV